MFEAGQVWTFRGAQGYGIVTSVGVFTTDAKSTQYMQIKLMTSDVSHISPPVGYYINGKTHLGEEFQLDTLIG